MSGEPTAIPSFLPNAANSVFSLSATDHSGWRLIHLVHLSKELAFRFINFLSSFPDVKSIDFSSYLYPFTPSDELGHFF